MNNKINHINKLYKYQKKIIYFLVFISFTFTLLLSYGSAVYASKAHQLPEMVYRIRVANDIDFMSNKFSGIKVKEIRLPAIDDIKIDDNPWSYVLVYVGIENIWFYQGNEMLNAVEAGVSIRGTEVHNKSGWHPFFNYYPKKKQPPFNDPEAWRGDTIPTDEPITLQLRVSDVENINNSWRWIVHFYVNGKEVTSGPVYANPGSSNQFDVKVCVGTYMASGDENEVSFAPFKIGDIEVSESTTYNKLWDTIELNNFGIPHQRIGYGTELNNTEKRNFKTDFETDDYSYSISLPEKKEKDNNGMLIFGLLAGLGFMLSN